MNLKSLSIAVSAVLLLLCCVSRAQPQNLTELIKEIQSNFDKTLDPCHDFYEFACGGFIKTHPLPKNTSEEYLNWPVFEAVVNDTVRIIKKVVSQPWPILNDLYRSCDRSPAEIHRSAEETYGAWTRYINSTSLSTSAEIFDVLAKLFYFSPFFDIIPDEFTVNRNETFLGPAIFPQADSPDWKNATEVAQFLEFVEGAFSNDSKSVAAEKAQTVVEVSRYVSGFKSVDFGIVKMTIANASRLTDIDWEAYFDNIGVKLNASTYIIIDEYYFKNFTKYVSGLPEQTIRNYLQFLVFEAVYSLNYIWGCQINGNSCIGHLIGYSDSSRDDRCALFVGDQVPDLVNFAITEETDAQSISAVERVANGLKEATNASLASLKWLSSARDVKIGSEKIQNVITMIGREKTSRYSEVETQPDNLFDNLINIFKGDFREQIRDSYRLPERTDIDTYTSLDVVNKQQSNLIYVPATLINSEVFSSNWPKLFQFAKLGGLIGRQFIHAIDGQGQYFDSVGHQAFYTLFSRNTTQKYQNATECVLGTYNNYTFGNSTFKAEKSLDEDIADIGGLRNAFYAYHAYIARYGKEFPDGGVIPGFSTDQVFFLISAQMSCSVENDKYTKYQAEYSRYAPNKIRTNGAVSQSTEFAKAFNCPINSPMNPAQKCSIF